MYIKPYIPSENVNIEGRIYMSWKKNLTITTILAGTTAIGIHLINKAIYLSATLDNLLSHTPENYYEWKFGKIFYQKNGSGKPVLLIHDLSTYSSSYEWNQIIDKLSNNRTVYAIDLLGCGRSDKPSLTYTNYLYVQMITDFIQNIIKDKTDIIVTGESSSFILGSCQNNHDIINRIIMINPSDIQTSAFIPNNKSKILTALIQLPLVGTLLYNILTQRKNLENLFYTEYFYDKSKIEEKTIKTYYESAHIGNAESKNLFSSISGRYLTSNIKLYLNNLNNSIFIISGCKEKYYKIASNYKNILPSIEITSIDETAYLPQLEKPDDILEQINVYLDDSVE